MYIFIVNDLVSLKFSISALLFFFQLLTSIQKIKILKNLGTEFENLDAIVTGWGITSPSSNVSNILLEAEVISDHNEPTL